MKSNGSTKTQKIILPKSRTARPRYFFRSTFNCNQPRALQRHALVVDDDKSVRHAIKTVLERRFHLKVHLASNGAEGVRQVSSHHYDLIVSDVNMPVMDGMAFYDWLDKNQHQDIDKFLFVTGGNNFNADIHTFRNGSVRVLDKPFSLMELVDSCHTILRS